MVYLKQQRPEKVTVPAVRASKERGEKLVCLTAYDYPTARIVDEAGTDIILVGDSLGNVVLGYDSTVPVTLEEMLHHARAVRRGVERALLVADMPYGTYHTGPDDAVRAALRLIKEGGAEAVKLEGGRARVEVVRRLVAEEIPVMGHVGLTPQSLNKLGNYRLQAKTADAARALVEDALALEEAGVFARRPRSRPARDRARRHRGASRPHHRHRRGRRLRRADTRHARPARPLVQQDAARASSGSTRTCARR